MTMKLNAVCVWHTGLIRKMNEDCFLFFDEILDGKHCTQEGVLECQNDWKSRTFLAVFDGVAGMPCGEEASRAAAYALKNIPKKRIWESVCKYLDRVSNLLNTRVIRRGRELGEEQICSTVVGLYFGRKRLWMFNVGDSRCYLYRNGCLRQLSKDHTDEESLRLRGLENRRPKLIQYLGTASEEVQVEPYIFEYKPEVGDVILLCSDGITDLVSDGQMEEVLCTGEPIGKRARLLLQKALEAGGNDNATVMALSFEMANNR